MTVPPVTLATAVALPYPGHDVQPPPIPADEPARLAALRRYEILDTEDEVAFDRVTRLASALFGVPVALVSFVDAHRQWFKSCVGLADRETPREWSFCSHAILEPEVLVVPDALVDPRFEDNPLVTGPVHIRFYAGAPLRTRAGLGLGTLCVIDTRPRHDFGSLERERLADLAALVVDELELRSMAGDLTAARDAARRANDAKTTMISFISHELRSPLTTIFGFADILTASELPVAQHDAAERIARAAEHMNAIVDDLLDVTRLEQGELALACEDVVVTEVIDEVVKQARPLATDHDVAVAIGDVVGVGVEVAADRVRLRQVLWNLVSNAVKYNRPGGDVQVGAKPSGSRVVISVTDTGRGIPAADREAIFTPFVRLAGAADRQGVGLGLAICRRLVEQMGGSVTVTDAPGGGSRFEVTLPAAG